MPTESILRCEAVVQIYRVATGEVHALRGVDADFAPASLTAVVGPSGSGKSTLMRLLAMNERPTGGRIVVAGVDVLSARPRRIRSLRRSAVALVTQRPTHNLFPHLTVREHLALMARRRSVGLDLDVAERLGLADRLDHRPDRLSGGEQQRTAVAMATVGSPPIVLADEPTAELDADSATLVVAHLHQLARDGATVVVNTHDATVSSSADRVLSLHHGTMHSERHRGRTVAIIDAVGRVQIPAELLERFPGRRVVIEPTDIGLVLRPPTEGSGDE